jgi:hypothetical protein
MKCRYLIVHSKGITAGSRGGSLLKGSYSMNESAGLNFFLVSNVQQMESSFKRTKNWNQSEMSIWHKTKSISTEACRTSKTGATTCLFMRCDWAEGIEATYSRRQLIVGRNVEQEIER